MRRLTAGLLRQRRRGLSTDVLWSVVVLAGFLFVVSLVPLPPNDIWWHLKVGEQILETGIIPTIDTFAWTLPAGTPYFYGVWLGEVLFSVLHGWGGLELLIATRTLIVSVTFWLVAVQAQRSSGSWRVAAVVLALACLMSLNNLIVRPQIWSFLPAMVFLVCLDRFACGELSGKWLLLCPGAMVLWVNLHGAFVLGLVLLGAYTCGEGLSAVMGASREESRHRAGTLAFVLVLTALATLANPRGLGIVDYVYRLLADPTTQELLVDWQAPTPSGVANVSFYLSVLLLLSTFLYSRYRPTPTEAMLICGFLWLAWNGQRYVIWFGLFVMPILAKAFTGLSECFPRTLRYRNQLNTVLAILLFVPVVLVQPWWVDQMPLPQSAVARLLMRTEVGPLLHTSTPVAAVEFLKSKPGGRLYNDLGYGSYLIWAMPEQGVFIDPRIELYPDELVRDYIRIGYGVRYNELLQHYGADRILLSMENQKELALALEHDAMWEKEYGDAYTQVWRRVNDV